MMTRTADRLFFVLSLIAFAWLLVEGRGGTFYADEWRFIVERSALSPDDLMRPANEHWSILAILVYRGFLALVGLHSYLPYLAGLLLFHLVVAAAVYRLVRRSGPAGLAVLAGSLVLFLGSGFENLFWAFQMGFVGSIAAGLWALVLVSSADELAERRPLWLTCAALLLLVSVAAQGVGLFFVAAVAVELLAQPARRRWLAIIAPAVLAYGAWFISYGRAAAADRRDPFTLQALSEVPAFVLAGFQYAIGWLSALGPVAGLVATGGLVVWLAIRLRGRRALPARTLGALAGIVAQFALIGLVRGQYGPENAGAPRYVYPAAIFLVLAIAPLVAEVRLPAVGRRRVTALGVSAALFAVALAGNLRQAVLGADFYATQAARTRAIITAALEAPDVPGAAGVLALYWLPPPARLMEVVRTYGDPNRDDLVPGVARPVGADVLDAARRQLRGGG